VILPFTYPTASNAADYWRWLTASTRRVGALEDSGETAPISSSSNNRAPAPIAVGLVDPVYAQTGSGYSLVTFDYF
jgi:hypothetical protein